MTSAECFCCGASASEIFGNNYLCDDCIPDGDSRDEEKRGDDGERDHENPIDVSDVTDEDRAKMLREYLESYVAEFGDIPRLMPLDKKGKAPIIQGRCRLDSPEGRSYLVEGEEAIHQIREEGARGFAIYAGKWDHGTEDAAFADVDDRETFPFEAFDETLTVLSGSGRGPHLTYRNAGNLSNAKGKGDVDGEICAENWYCVVPGSVHPTGGVYHVIKDNDVAELANEDLPSELQPGSAAQRDRNDEPTAVDLNGEGDTPEEGDLRDRLEAAFNNSHDGERIKNVYNGRYNAAGFDDRSSAEFWLANRLDSWVGHGSRQIVERLMDDANLQKWAERTDRGYRDSILMNVGYQDWYYDPESDDDNAYGGGRAVSALPIAQLDALDPQERRRYAKQRGLEWPSTDEARKELFDTIADVIRNEDDCVINASTSLGKTYTIAATRWGARTELTGERPVVHLLETCDARDEAIQTAEEEGGQYHVLLGRTEACPVAAGDHDDAISIEGAPVSEWLDTMCDGKNISFSTAHRYLEEHNDQGATLPCCEEGGCHAVKQWDEYREGPDGDLEYWPLVIATHNFAFTPGLRMHNNIVVDEQPSFEQDFSTDRIRKAVGAYLREIDAPVSTWEAFIQLSRNEQYRTDAACERDALDNALSQEPNRDWYFEDPDAHVLAPALARAIFRAEDRANGRRFGKTVHEPPRLEASARDDDDWNREWVSVVLDEANDIRFVRVVPDFEAARSVIGLDAHPAAPLWQANTVPWIKTKQVLEPEARQLWRRYERGLRVVQVGDATRPLSGNKALEWLNENQLEALFEHLVDKYGAQFRTCITTAQVEGRVEELMNNAGVHRPELMHFGEEKSRNDFATEQVGLVNGCMDPGDDYVLDLLAELDLDAEAETAVTDDGEEYRARGRGFVGDDADSAAEILASVRENHIAQAAGRYARSPTDPESTATVFVRTDAVPDHFSDVEVPGVEWVFGNVQEAIVDELRSSPQSRTAKEIAETVGCSKEHVRTTLRRLADTEYGKPAVQLTEDAGVNGATLYSDSGVPHTGVCDLGESPTGPYRDSSKWALVIRSLVERGNVDRSLASDKITERFVWDWSSGGGVPPD